MDWSRIKSIFIISFLVLNVFLIQEFFNKKNASQIDTLSDSSIEQQLAANNITYEDLPEDSGQVLTITGVSKTFTERDIAALENQNAQLLMDGQKIVSSFDEPVPILDSSGEISSQAFLSLVKFGDEYVFLEKNEERQALYFVQHFDTRRIFNNEAATLVAYFNEDNQIISYEQMYLDSLSEMKSDDEPEEIITAIKALESLYVRNLIRPNSEVTSAELGYYKLVTVTSGVEVLVPTWRFIIDEDDVYYVNSIEGQIINLND